MRPMRCACAFLMAMAMVTACGGDGGGRRDGSWRRTTGGTVTLNATENAVAAGLTALATRIGAADADARRFANALAFTVQAGGHRHGNRRRDEPRPDGRRTRDGGCVFDVRSASASTALVTRRVLGYSLTVRTDAPGQRTYRGVIVWDAAGLKVIVTVLGNPNVLNVTLPMLGNTVYLIGSQTQVWAAMEENINWTLFNGNSLDCPRPLPNVLSVSRLRRRRRPVRGLVILAGVVRREYRERFADCLARQTEDRRRVWCGLLLPEQAVE